MSRSVYWALLFPHWIHFYLLNLLSVVNIFKPERPKTGVISFMSPKIFHLVFSSLKISLASTNFFLSPQLVPWIRTHTCKVQSHQQRPPITIPHTSLQPLFSALTLNTPLRNALLPPGWATHHSQNVPLMLLFSVSHLPFPAASVSCPNHQLTTFYLYTNFVLIFNF